MGAYQYCGSCSGGMGQPSPREILARSRDCPGCGIDNPVSWPEPDDFLAEVAEKVVGEEPSPAVVEALEPPIAAAVRAERERTSDGLAICASRLRKAGLVEAIGAASTFADVKAILGRVIAEL